MPSSSTKPRVRTLHGIDHDAARFRPETVERQERPRLTAKIGEFCMAKQMARMDVQGQQDR